MKKHLWMILSAVMLFSCSKAKVDNSAKQTAATQPAATETVTYYETTDEMAPVVYFTKDISSAGLVRAYEALGWKPNGKVGVKISTGESAKTNHLRPALIKDLVQKVNGTIVECNTAYGGSRATVALHHQAVKERGYLDIAPFDLLDEEGYMTLPVNGKVLKEDYVGSHFKNYGAYLVLSHFKGHQMGGFGGALKNLSIGFGSGTSAEKSGKAIIHTGGRSASSIDWATEKQIPFLEAMGEAAVAVCQAMDNGRNIAFVNVMNRLSVDCDCNANPAEPDMHDIGILASLDPLALDQACIDKVWQAPDSASLKARIDRQQGRHILEYTDTLGLYHRRYRLVNLDK
ncbi:MAG: DUF362 domain-containing protein [Victivallales bacterium]|nr:DUF362 domain-containing protein [Victivallales bacterium]